MKELRHTPSRQRATSEPPSPAKTRIFTRRGDSGQTDFPALGRIAKSHPMLEACGSLDELNCAMGELAARIRTSSLEMAERRTILRQLRRIQGELLGLGSLMSSAWGRARNRPARPRAMFRRLESEIEAMEAGLSPCRSFLLPGSNLLSSAAHLARAICRRAERNCVAVLGNEPPADSVLPYLNRLSDWLFVLARRLSKLSGQEDTFWRGPRKSRFRRSSR